MSTAKRSRRRPADGRSVSPQPDAKRLKVAKSSHVPSKNGLGFLVDENARAGKKLEARLTNGVPASKSTLVDDSRTIVASDKVHEDGPKIKNSQKIIDVSSDDDSSSVDDDDEEADDTATEHGVEHSHKPMNGHASEAEEDTDDHAGLDGQKSKLLKSLDNADNSEEDNVLEEPTFGDLLKSRHPEPLDIGGSGPSQALVPAPDNRGLAPPSSNSLATVLTQALKTNDKDLLESCFRLTDLISIRSTIQRLSSQYAGALLQRIAERIHKRPGRTGSLMVWIQWSLVAHGAYISNQPEIMRKVKALTRVVRERANGLQPMLHLKGKLDLLSAQLELRRSLNGPAGQPDDEDDEDAVRYVEGEDEDEEEWSESDGEAEMGVSQTQQPAARREDIRPKVNGSANGLTNGVENDDEDDDNIKNADGLLDLEAEESEDEDEEKDSDEEAESEEDLSDGEDDFLDDDDDGSDMGVEPPKHKTLNRKR